MSRFPALAGVARRYVGAPCTSVESERLFSSSGHVFTDQRNRLAAERAEMIIFVKHNQPITLTIENILKQIFGG